MSSLTTSTAAYVRGALRERGASQTDLATAMGLSQAAVSRRLSGAVPLNVDELGAVADFLGLDPRELLEPRPDGDL